MRRVFDLLSSVPWIVWFLLDVALKVILILPLLAWIASCKTPDLQPPLGDVVAGATISLALGVAAALWLMRDTKTRGLGRAGFWVVFVLVSPVFGPAIYVRSTPANG